MGLGLCLTAVNLALYLVLYTAYFKMNKKLALSLLLDVGCTERIYLVSASPIRHQ